MVEERTKAQLVEELEKSEDRARRLADEARFLFSLMQIASTAESFDETLQRCIDIVCEHIGWPVGHLYIPDPMSDGELQPTSIWHLDDPRAFENFRSITDQTRFLPGIGLPGRILSSGEPAWITDVQEDDNFPRNTTGDDIKVRGGFGFPIKIGSETVAVVEFFTVEPKERDPGIVDLMGLVGYQIGRVLERERSREILVQQAAVFFNISSILGKPGAYDEKLDLAMRELARVADADGATLRVSDPEGNGLRLVARVGAMSSATYGPEPSALANSAMESGQPVVVNDYQAHPDALQWVISGGVKSLVSLPIKGTGKNVALTVVYSKEIDHFDSERVRLLKAIVDGLGPLLENARLDQQVREELEQRRQTEAKLLQKSEELEALFKISSTLGEPGDYEIKLNYVLEELLRVADASFASLRAPDPLEGGLRLIARAGQDSRPLASIKNIIGSSASTRAMESGQPIVSNDYQSQPDAEPTTVLEGARSLICLPIKVNEETFAVATVFSRETGHFDSERVGLLIAIADGLGPLLENARLNDEIAVKEEALRQSQKLESVGQLAAGVAHEVNNPLSAILGFSKLLLGQNIPDQAKQDVQIIFDEAQRGTTIIQDLLSFARKGSSEKKAIEISGGLNRVLNLKAADFRANHVKVNLEIEDDLPEVEADEQQLQQVYLNLLTNAQHAMFDANDGGNIAIQCKRVDDVLRLSFVDDGPGMKKETLEKIFEPFFTTKALGVGTGLGLSVCYGIIADHGGRLWAESEPDGGATFFIELPCLVEAETSSTMAGH